MRPKTERWDTDGTPDSREQVEQGVEWVALVTRRQNLGMRGEGPGRIEEIRGKVQML